MKLRLTIISVLLIISGVQAQNADNQLLPGSKTLKDITQNELLGIVSELTSPEYGGRLSGSPGYLKAAEWVASEFKKWGVKPANDGSYFQYFGNAYSEVLSAGKLTWHRTNPGGSVADVEYSFPDDYFPGSNSGSGTVTAEVVFAGFGISAPELGWDDYAGIDVKGKIVLLENGVPYSKNDSTLEKWTPYTYHRYKFRNAAEHGAAGLLYSGKTANPNTSYLDHFIYAHIDTRITEALFEAAGKEYSEVKKQITENFSPGSFSLGQTITISASTRNFPESKACNVVGLIEGSDPDLKNEVIIIGAHLDGQGSLGGTVFPGALDNASGCADILAAAKALSRLKEKPKRSVLFILFGGEECGLYGSTCYVENPLFPPGKTIFMANLDMVGNGTGFNLSSALSYPEIYNHFFDSNENFLHRKMEASEARPNFGRPRSDGAVFRKAGFKTIEIWTSGTVKPVYYHDPSDNADALTPDIMEDAAKLLFLSIVGVADDTAIKTGK